jgi:excisionase family DNA binding protein
METYLTIEECADYLKLKIQTIRRWVLKREIPFHKIKSVIRFRVSELETWINTDGKNLVAREKPESEGGLFGEAGGEE